MNLLFALIPITRFPISPCISMADLPDTPSAILLKKLVVICRMDYSPREERYFFHLPRSIWAEDTEARALEASLEALANALCQTLNSPPCVEGLQRAVTEAREIDEILARLLPAGPLLGESNGASTSFAQQIRELLPTLIRHLNVSIAALRGVHFSDKRAR